MRSLFEAFLFACSTPEAFIVKHRSVDENRNFYLTRPIVKKVLQRFFKRALKEKGSPLSCLLCFNHFMLFALPQPLNGKTLFNKTEKITSTRIIVIRIKVLLFESKGNMRVFKGIVAYKQKNHNPIASLHC